ncbi:MAG: hypothetical protein ABL874_00420, partial [Sphingopyxis sp.]
LGLAGTILPMLGGVPRGPSANRISAQTERGDLWGAASRTPSSPCTVEARALLAELENVRNNIALLQDAVAAGEATPIQARALTQSIEREDALVGRLTITIGQARFAPAASSPTVIRESNHLPAPSPSVYARWFNNPEAESSHIIGNAFGYRVGWVANTADYDALRADTRPLTFPTSPTRNFYYRQPVPATLVAGPCLRAASAICTFDESPEGDAASAALNAALPQLGPLRAVPIGSSGIFSSRTFGATLDASGVPLTLAYTADPGAEAIAASIDSAGDLATALHNAELDRLNHAIELREAREKLNAPPATDGGATGG